MKSLIQEFLYYADKATDVEYVMWPEPGVRVPEELFDRFAKLRTQTPPPSEDPLPDAEAELPDAPVVDEVTEPAKRKPGRPKKIQEGQ